jgi:hypothetical protein
MENFKIWLIKIGLVLIAIGTTGNAIRIYNELHPKNSDSFRTPYSVKVLSDHEVQLSSKNDTISLFLENSGIFNNEETVFIKHK